MYQALYRKYRPQVFADVVGQEHVTKTLMNEIKTGRTSHAYLFTGSRGTGKTTCAKIFAKAVNCEHPNDGDPCNECETCRGIDNGSVMDVVEIDAASNNGVDSIRDIRDEANFTPVNGKYRVYIIDEVHMLSIGAFNALLKTLEEPPEHVKFILATTEVHKLPATILSRCQRFDFKRISPEDIAGRVLYVADKEGLEVTQEAANLIARLADGALRDALSILDQCMGHGKYIDEAVVNEVVGLTGKQHQFDLADAIIRHDSASALDQINELHNNSIDMERLCSELINHFRNLMVCRAVSDPQNLIVCSPQELQEYQNAARNCSMADIMNALNVLGDTLTYIRKGLNRRVEMEMAIIRLCNGEVSQPAAANPVKTQAAPPRSVPHQAPKPVSRPAPTRAARPAPPKPPEAAEAPAQKPAAPAEPDPVPPQNDYEPPLPDDSMAPPPDDETPLPEPPFEAQPAQVAEHPAVQASPQAAPHAAQEPAAQSGSAAPAEDQPAANSADDGPLSQQTWSTITRELTRHDKALIGITTGAQAARVGKTIEIVPNNELFERFLGMPIHQEAVRRATKAVFGVTLEPRVVKSIRKSPGNKEKQNEDPLESFLTKAKALGVPVEIKE